MGAPRRAPTSAPARRLLKGRATLSQRSESWTPPAIADAPSPSRPRSSPSASPTSPPRSGSSAARRSCARPSPRGARPRRRRRPSSTPPSGWPCCCSSVVWHRELSAAIAPLPRTRAPAARYPSITVIRPVRGKDVGADENFAAALDTGYPGDVETLFVFDDDNDPGLPVAREVVARHRASGRPGRAEVIVAGSPPPGRTGKLNAMIVGAARAQRRAHRVRRLRHAARSATCCAASSRRCWRRRGAGSAFAPVLVNQPPRAAGDVLYALMQNAMYSPLAAFAAGERRDAAVHHGPAHGVPPRGARGHRRRRRRRASSSTTCTSASALHEAGYEQRHEPRTRCTSPPAA